MAHWGVPLTKNAMQAWGITLLILKYDTKSGGVKLSVFKSFEPEMYWYGNHNAAGLLNKYCHKVIIIIYTSVLYIGPYTGTIDCIVLQVIHKANNFWNHWKDTTYTVFCACFSSLLQFCAVSQHFTKPFLHKIQLNAPPPPAQKCNVVNPRTQHLLTVALIADTSYVLILKFWHTNLYSQLWEWTCTPTWVQKFGKLCTAPIAKFYTHTMKK